MPLLIGIDCGLTVTKAVVFDATGRVLATARRASQQLKPAPRHVERDMDDLWAACAATIAEALALSGRPASDVAALAATAHGDGVYLLDRAARPLGAGILSLDSRAVEEVETWQASGIAARALGLTGQKPHASAPSALLAWIARHQPERYARIGHVLACKDWLTFCLTGRIGTDVTEASTSFTNVGTQVYDPDVLALFGLELPLPEIAPCEAVVGTLTEAAARATGLLPGTPVVAGLHDVTASSLGIGGHARGVIAVVAGTYSINETVSASPRTDARWFCRNGVRPGEWHPMAISPASAANYDWFLDTLTDRGAHPDIHTHLAPEIAAALARPSSAFFHPYLFGSPHAGRASAGFFGLHGWHDRGDLLRAVLEGIAFNHRLHVEALRDGFSVSEVRLTGGISRNPLFAQLFADALGLPVTVTATEEAAAWGAALCAGAGAGLWPTPFDDPRALATTTFRPERDLTRRYRLHCDLVAALAPLWPRLEAEDV